ncbi:MAG TPA: hypothetical protein P5079_04610, partial [Elusimicrobiota bacterium]|nr:hypothetical protein [Elusimicrobiota bacterium]
MTDGLSFIRRRLRRARFWKAGYAVLLIFQKTLVFFGASGMSIFLADRLFPLSPAVRMGAWLVLTAGSLALAAANGVRPRQWRSSAVAAELGSPLHPADCVLNAWEMGRGDIAKRAVSPELVEREVERVCQRLRPLSVGKTMRPGNWRRWTALATATSLLVSGLFLLLPENARASLWGAYCPFALRENLAGVSVDPGDARVPVGGDVPIRVTLRTPSVSPELWLKRGATWQKRDLFKTAERDFSHTLKNLLEPVSYKVRHQGRWSRVYRIEPFRPPRFERFRVDIVYPPYTRKPRERQENVMTTRVLRGAALTARGRLDRKVDDLAVTSPDGRVWSATLNDGDALEMSLTAHESAELHFALKSGAARDELVWRIEVEDDRAPHVQILSPAQDLLLSANEKLPMTFTATDDFG